MPTREELLALQDSAWDGDLDELRSDPGPGPGVRHVLVDTSVWIEYLRGTGSPAHHFSGTNVGLTLATTEPVLMELLAGAASGRQAEAAEKLMLARHWLQVQPALDYRSAANIFRRSERSGTSLGLCRTVDRRERSRSVP